MAANNDEHSRSRINAGAMVTARDGGIVALSNSNGDSGYGDICRQAGSVTSATKEGSSTVAIAAEIAAALAVTRMTADRISASRGDVGYGK